MHAVCSGVVPSSFRILRQLMSRVEDPATGEVLVPELHIDIPAERRAQIEASVDVVGPSVRGAYPLVDGA